MYNVSRSFAIYIYGGILQRCFSPSALYIFFDSIVVKTVVCMYAIRIVKLSYVLVVLNYYVEEKVKL